VRLTSTIRACQLPLEPFAKLIEANRRDQVVWRYETFGELVDYCALSANPVGELVLRVFDAATPERLALSDRVCTGLQLVEHLQDIGEDLGRGRVYVPAEDLFRFDCAEADLAAATASPRMRALVRFEATRARHFLDAAAPLVATLPGRLRVAVAGFAAGGLAAADAIERADGDVLGVRCRPRKHRVVIQLTSVLWAARRETGPSGASPPDVSSAAAGRRRPADVADCPSGASPPEVSSPAAGRRRPADVADCPSGASPPEVSSAAAGRRRPADVADCPSGASPPEWAAKEGQR
jgi:squalene synthase HpnC